MARRRERLVPTHHRALTPAPTASKREIGLLRLQRLAGNRAVRHLLREPAPLLGGLDAGTKQKLQIATVNVPSDFADDETFARADPKELKDFDVQFGAKVPKDQNLRKGVKVVAWDMFDPAGQPNDVESPFRNNSTVTLELDLKAFKGENGLWQFTIVTTGKSPKKHLLIDYIGPAPKYDASDAAAKRFGELGMKLRSGTAGFRPDEKDAIYSAVSLLPAVAVAKLPKNLSFVRDHTPHPGGKCTTATAKAGGAYCSADHTIQLFDRWKDSQVRYARATSQTATVLHELGHAIDDANKDAHAAFAKAVASDGGTAISGYGGTSTFESFAECFFLFIADPKMLEALRPNVYAYFVGTYGAAGSTTPPSGSGAAAGKTSATPVKAGSGSAAAPKH